MTADHPLRYSSSRVPDTWAVLFGGSAYDSLRRLHDKKMCGRSVQTPSERKGIRKACAQTRRSRDAEVSQATAAPGPSGRDQVSPCLTVDSVPWFAPASALPSASFSAPIIISGKFFLLLYSPWLHLWCSLGSPLLGEPCSLHHLPPAGGGLRRP